MAAKSKKPKQSELIPVPLPWDSPDFAAAWDDWEAFRKEIRKPVTPTVRRIQLAKLKDMGKALAIESINQSINSGWQGLFLPKSNGNGHSHAQDDAQRPEPPPPCPDWRERLTRLEGGKRKITLRFRDYEQHDPFLREKLLAMDMNGSGQ